MRRSLAIACAMLASSANADVGIGVSAKTDSATVYIPITVQRFMLEPYVRATDRESDSVSTTGTIVPITSESTSQVEANAVGLGVFRLVPLADDRFTLYYGGRLARIDEKAETFSTTGIDTSSNVEGHSIIPTLGFHYSIMERLSIGAEIGLEHSEVDAETVNRSQTGAITQSSISEITSNDTRANVILRFFF